MENMEQIEVHDVRTPRGHHARMGCRAGTSDLATVGSTFELWGQLHDEYGTADIFLDDGAFVDVGAHIGSVAIAVLLDNPRAHAICVEPLPENVELLRANARRNGVNERLHVVEGAAGRGKTVVVRYGPDDAHRYIANIRGATGEYVTVPAITLAQIVRLAGGRIDAMKIDCEGGEYALFAAKPETLRKVGRITGEYHGGEQPLLDLLDRTHAVTVTRGDRYVGHFEAVPR
jgi:FkbM family methyltransferase